MYEFAVVLWTREDNIFMEDVLTDSKTKTKHFDFGASEAITSRAM